MCSGLSHEKVSFPLECVEVTVLNAGGRGSLPGPTSVTIRTFHQTLTRPVWLWTTAGGSESFTYTPFYTHLPSLPAIQVQG